MAEAKKKNPKFTSPKGTFKFPKLSEPDYGSKEYPKPDGVYSVNLVLPADAPEIKAFIAKLQPLHDAAVEEAEQEAKQLKIESRKKLEAKNGKSLVAVNGFFTTLYDRETEEPTGEIEFKFSMGAGGEFKKGPKAGQRWAAKPALFDAKGTPMVKAPNIWGGTLGRVSFEAQSYFIIGTGAVGLKLKLQATQIIDLVSEGQRSASSYGFGEEDGYGYSEAEAETSNQAEGDNDTPFTTEENDDF